MKRLFLAFGLCLLSFSAQAATCSVTSPLAKDATASPQTFNVPYADDGSGSGACEPKVFTNVPDGNDVTLGAKADAAWVSGSGSVVAILKNVAAAVANAIPAGGSRIGFVSDDPCAQATKTNFAIGAATGTIQIVGGSSTKQVYLCSLSLIAASTAVVNLIEGTGAGCVTANEAAVLGSTTAANGMSLAANGGLTLGNGSGTVARTATAANGLCILQSGTTALAGNATYVQQ